MDPKVESTLQLFSAKAERLDRSRFRAFLRDRALGWSFVKKNGRWVLDEWTAADDDERDAFVLTLRFFIQDNEPTSLRNVRSIFESVAVPLAARDQALALLRELNRYLDSDSPLGSGSVRMTRRGVFECVVFGDLAHANGAKRQTFLSWTEQPGTRAMLETEFYEIAEAVLETILAVKPLGEQVLASARSAARDAI